MSRSPLDPSVLRLTRNPGLSVQINRNGSLRRIDAGDVVLNLFIGSALEGGPANLFLRRHGDTMQCTALLGPRSPTRFGVDPQRNALVGTGQWLGIRYRVVLTLAAAMPAWFWHVSLENTGSQPLDVDLVHAQDLALAPYGAIRLNEYYVSQYVDHTPLRHDERGWVVASRQNQALGVQHPWCVMGSLNHGVSFATDALQLQGLASRAGAAAALWDGLRHGLPGRRRQHEHSMAVLQDAPQRLQPGAQVALGFFGNVLNDHPAATSAADLAVVDRVLALPEAVAAPDVDVAFEPLPAAASLFDAAPLLAAIDLDEAELQARFGGPWRHEEFDDQGRRLSFFHGTDRHVVLRAKELAVLRPHGHLLRTGRHTTPDETALTSTVWMAGVFHSMLTQGHVSINRFLSTVRGYLGLFRGHGQRVFVELDGVFQLLDVPSAFEMTPDGCCWIYRHAGGCIEVQARAHHDPQSLGLTVRVLQGAPLRCLVSHHVALGGDDGNEAGAPRWWRDDEGIAVGTTAGSELGRRFPQGCFRIDAAAGTVFERVGGDELLFLDGASRQQPWLCVVCARADEVELRLRGLLVADSPDTPPADNPDPWLATDLSIVAPAASPLAGQAAQLADIVPWYLHNALVHHLAPRGLEQYSGGGWGTRDVCQGPVEMQLAFGRMAPVRDLLLRVMRAQNADGDWPQWFMFFERERQIRAGDSHGDIVFWPLLALAQYLIASGDAAVLDQPVPFFDAPDATVWQHAERALALISRRVVGGTVLAAYGHGDWNDALQPADPAMREQMCSAWTVTLHHQVLTTLARALRSLRRDAEAAAFEAQAVAVQREFQRVLLVDDVLAGYALFEEGGGIRHLLHPRDTTTGVRYSVLAMIHAILEDMLSPDQVRSHLQLIRNHLSGPDGVRLFDRPMPYHGGPMRHFQRAESSSFFGREIGLMYMHAHLRYAQALAHVGDAGGFFVALCKAQPIGIRALVPTATLRQANCYYSSSDAAFEDRYQAADEYRRIAQGGIALDGGWRVYSSGAGIALGLIVRRFLGLNCEHATLEVDPVMPPVLDGLRVAVTMWGRPLEVVYRVQGAGCGVAALRLNGHPLPLTHRPNPHRVGAAQVAKALVLGHLRGDGNVLLMDVGGAAASG